MFNDFRMFLCLKYYVTCFRFHALETLKWVNKTHKYFFDHQDHIISLSSLSEVSKSRTVPACEMWELPFTGMQNWWHAWVASPENCESPIHYSSLYGVNKWMNRWRKVSEWALLLLGCWFNFYMVCMIPSKSKLWWWWYDVSSEYIRSYHISLCINRPTTHSCQSIYKHTNTDRYVFFTKKKNYKLYSCNTHYNPEDPPQC